MKRDVTQIQISLVSTRSLCIHGSQTTCLTFKNRVCVFRESWSLFSSAWFPYPHLLVSSFRKLSSHTLDTFFFFFFFWPSCSIWSSGPGIRSELQLPPCWSGDQTCILVLQMPLISLHHSRNSKDYHFGKIVNKHVPGIPAMAQQDQWHLCSARMQVQAPAWQSGLRIPNYCGLDLIPGPGTPYAEGWPKMKKKKKKEKEKEACPALSWLRRVPSLSKHASSQESES